MKKQPELYKSREDQAKFLRWLRKMHFKNGTNMAWIRERKAMRQSMCLQMQVISELIDGKIIAAYEVLCPAQYPS